MYHRTAPALLLLTALLTAGCSDGTDPYAPEVEAPVQAAVVGDLACVPAPDVVVTSGPALGAALVGAAPGTVIAVSGFFDFEGDAVVTASDVTLTCATPGDGFHGLVHSYPGRPLITVDATGFTLEGVTVTSPGGGDLYSAVAVALPSASGLTVRGNALHCGWAQCVYDRAPGGVIEDNRFIGYRGTTMGLTLDDSDGTVVANNSFEARAGWYAGMQIRGGVGMKVLGNVLDGWYHGIVASGMTESEFAGNRINTDFSGFYLRGPLGTDRNVFRRNTIQVKQAIGVLLSGGCYNTFEGNRIVAGYDRNVYFFPATGGNLWRGDPRGVVDGGRLDCDGDGVADPNQVPGSRRP